MVETQNTYTSGRGVEYTLADHATQVWARIPNNVGQAVITLQPDNVWRAALEAWPESHRPGFALRQADVLQSYTA